MSKKCYQYKLEDGEYKFINEFKTQTIAANSVGVAESNLRLNLNTGVPYKGYEWWDEESHVAFCIEHFGTAYHPSQVAFKKKLTDEDVVEFLHSDNKESDTLKKLFVGPQRLRLENNVLIVGDLHAPFERVGYLEFCKDIYIKHSCNKVVFIGDLIDNHFSSFHDVDPDGHSAAEELRLAKLSVAKWYKTFPKAKVCLGNHDNIPVRKAFNGGLSSAWIKSVGEVMDTPEWEYADEFIIDDVLYTHGIGRKAAARMQADLTSVVQGHYHSEGYVQYSVGRNYKLFAMQVGCGINDKSYAMAYGKHFNKMHISCGVVLENGKLPLLEYMEL